MNANRFTCWLASYLMSCVVSRTIKARAADFVIGETNNPYMYRWWIIPRNRWFNIYLHHIVRDDDDRALHDHPWISLSLMLSGSLGEIHGVEESRRVLRPGDIVWRNSRFQHRLFLPMPNDQSDSAGAWTIFVTGPRIREWGFWCPGGRWVPWQDFTAPGDSSKIGKGCE